MANGGWYGTKEEWSRIEAPLLTLDAELEAFAKEHRLELSKNGRDWPERSLRWILEEIPCLIQVWLADDKSLALNFWICASQDRGDERYWRREMLTENAAAVEVRGALPLLLETGKTKLEDWCSRPWEFEFATKQSGRP